MTRTYAAPAMTIGARMFTWGARTYIMGVINTSPESFSGDGLRTIEDAVAQAHRMAAQGADILDIGGQSTRPGAVKSDAGFDELEPAEEIRRVVPVIERVRAELPTMPLSVDTYKPEVAREAVAAGAHIVNDIEGFRRDPAMVRVVADAGVPAIVMHNQRRRAADDVIAAIAGGLRASMRIAAEAGIGPDRLIADPGFGFGWTPAQNVEMLRRLRELEALGVPLLVGTSRKSTIGTLLGGAPADQRAIGSIASAVVAIANGASMVRVHDVAETRQAALVADAIVRGWPPAEEA